MSRHGCAWLLRRIAPLLLLAAAGCGYQLAGTADPSAGDQPRSLYRHDVQTVAVPTFTNVTYRRGLEQSLSKAIVQNIEAHTPYKVVSEQTADTVLEGEIVFAGNLPLSVNPFTNLPQEQLFSITVNFTWKDLRTGQILVQRRNFDQKASYYPTLGEHPQVGSADAIQQLALGIVQELQADW